MIRIAIDGPSGAGKSSVAKAVADELKIIYVDTGALYRTIGMFMIENGVDPKNRNDVVDHLDSFTLDLQFKNGKQVILLDGVDVADKIRTPEVSMAASLVSAIPEVRQYLLDTQRGIAKNNSVIMDGRDIGTVILPNAEVKVFLTASPEARAKRRYEELVARGTNVEYEQVYRDLIERDNNDSTRNISPCVPAKDAIILDNSNFEPAETAAAVVKIIREIQMQPEENKAYKKAYKILAPILRFLMRINAVGTENIPENGGVLFCSNHINALDFISIAACTTRQISFIAKKELFSIPILRKIMTALGAIKIDRSGNDVGAIKAAISVTSNGGSAAIFPQGHRYPAINPSSTPVKHGAGLIAYRSGCDVVPVCIQVKGGKYGIFKKINVIFGTPIKNEEFNFTNGGRDEYERAANMIFNEIVKFSDYSSLPPYDPTKDKHVKSSSNKR